MKAELCPVCSGLGKTLDPEKWIKVPCHGCGGCGWVTVPEDHIFYPELKDNEKKGL